MKGKIVFISTVSFAFNQYLKDFIFKLSEEYDIYLISNFNNYEIINYNNAKIININFSRTPKLLDTFLLLKILSNNVNLIKPNIVYTISPITGFLFSFLNLFFRIKHIHFFTGQVWANKFGIKKYLLKFIDYFIGKNIDIALVDSPSQRMFLIRENIISHENSFVMGFGSIRGNKVSSMNIDLSLQINNKSKNLLYVGRINYEKGFDLILKFVEKNYNWLIEQKINIDIAGYYEDFALKKELDKYSDIIIYHGVLNDLSFLYKKSYFLILPSQREGFGSVVIEAGYFYTPSILSNIVGLVDAGSDGFSALFFEQNNFIDFEKKLFEIYDPEFNYIKYSRSSHEYSKKFYSDYMLEYFVRFNNLVVNE